MPDFDLAIVGSGFGGSLLAMIARRLDLRVVLIERGRHPRFAIGESASPLAGILLEQLADRYDLPRVRPLSAYGTWQRTYPEVGCGLKRGFTYFRHEQGRRYCPAPDRANQLLVAASPDDERSDTHWLRSNVDHFLVQEAIALGAEYVDETALEGLDRADGFTVHGARGGRPVRVSARFVVDASGPRGFLSRALGIGHRGFDGYPPTQALLSHFTGVGRCEEMAEFGVAPRKGAPHSADDRGVPRSADDRAAPRSADDRGAPRSADDRGAPRSADDRGVPRSADDRGVPRSADDRGAPLYGAPPYPIDDAALHHVFDGGWMWVLRFGNGVTSAGIAVTDALAADLKLADGALAWARFLARYPSIAAQFARAEPTREFTWMPRLTWRARAAAGDGWAMLPSAAAFVDPLFSTGIPLTLLGIERMARMLPETVGRPFTGRQAGREAPPHDLDTYSEVTLAEADHTADFVAGCYAAFPRFEEFAAYSMFYFAAASYGEMARRHGISPADARFLASHDAAFAAATRRLSPARTMCSLRSVAAAIERLNIAGLCDPSKQNWYPFEESVPALSGIESLP